MFKYEQEIMERNIKYREYYQDDKFKEFADFIAFLKTINLDSLQEGIGSIQRVLGVFHDFTGNKDNNDNTDKKEYKPRPLYKHFED